MMTIFCCSVGIRSETITPGNYINDTCVYFASYQISSCSLKENANHNLTSSRQILCNSTFIHLSSKAAAYLVFYFVGVSRGGEGVFWQIKQKLHFIKEPR
jgi:hypothetical protein